MGFAIPATDAAWLYLERRNMPMHIGSLAILTPPPDAGRDFLSRVIAAWRAETRFQPPFNLRLRHGPAGLTLPVWEDVSPAEIDLDYHLRHSALPAPGGERELGMLVSRLHSHPLDRSRPLWEIHLIEGLSNGRFALYTKLHHSQIDGMAGMDLLTRMTTEDPADRRMIPPWALGMPPRPVAPDEHRLSGLGRLALGTIDTLRRTSGALLTLADAALSARLDPGRSAVPYRAPPSILNGRVGAVRRFATQDYDFARIRRVATAASVSVNDVFLAICADALRHYLAGLEALPDRSLTAAVPVSLRQAGDGAMGNAIGMIFTPLHTDVVDPLARLRAIHGSADHAKHLMRKLPADARLTYASLLAAPFLIQLGLGAGLSHFPVCNLGISNVPGPQRALHYCGARIDRIHPLSLIFDGQALNITALSYADRFCLGFTGCRTSLPSLQRLAVLTGEALRALEASLHIESLEPEISSPSPSRD